METIQMLGSLGEFVGAIAVLATLIYISIQVRHGSLLLEANQRATEENTRLARAAAMDRYSDAVSRWRGRIIENNEVAGILHKALQEEEMDEVSQLRLENLMVDWHNTYRANFRRARTVRDEGLVRQAVLSVARQLSAFRVLREYWEWGRPFNELGAPDFTAAVDEELATPKANS
ncbi:MAG: hypothetical protein ABFS46_05815 [Myxococcota bacterium]